MTEQVTATTPEGIKILSILYGIYAAIMLFSGLALIAFAPAIQILMGEAIIPLYVAAATGAIGFVIVLAGIITAAVTWGLWNLSEWAWLLAVAFAILGLLHFPMGTIINIFILWYLFKPGVKTALKKRERRAADNAGSC